jgi:hypothetical protein
VPNRPFALVASAAAAALAVWAAPAAAQSRGDVPPVYAGGQRADMPATNPRAYPPQAGAALNQIFQSFGDWSRNHGSPRILLFWNRELGDETTTRYRDHVAGSVVTAVRPGVAVTAYDQTSGPERTTGGTYAGMSRNSSFDYETGFVNAFVRSGANVVDRNALMRKVSSRQGAGDRSDQQFVESVALEQGVDYLVEVLPDYQASPTGFMFTIKVTHLPTSRVKAQFRTNGLPENGPAQMVARPGGYEREVEDRNNPNNVAEALAADTMRRFF